MSSPIFTDVVQCKDSELLRGFSCCTDDGVNDDLDGSSAELMDVFEEEGCETEAWTPPVSEVRCKIAAQLEFYLSDENLETDAFLLKHVQRNSMGFVSLKLLTSFKKIRDLTRDWRTTLTAAQTSPHLEVNELGTKVRRKTLIPDRLLSMPTTKLLLVWNFQLNAASEFEACGSSKAEQQGLMETAVHMFGSHGTITSLRILRPGKEVPAELKRYSKKHTELGRKLCAVVEYEYLDGVRNAYEILKAQEQAQGGKGIRVVLLGSRGTRKQGGGLGRADEESEESVDQDFPTKPNWKSKKHLYCLEDSVLYSSSESDFAPASPRPNRRVSRPRSLYGSPLTIPRSSPSHSDPYRNPLASPEGSPFLPHKLYFGGHAASPLTASPLSSTPTSVCPSHARSRSSGDVSQDSAGYGGSPWVQRRKNATQAFFPEKSCTVTSDPLKGALGVEVLRQSLGPDGTKGFYNCIGRGKVLLPP